MDHIDRFFCCGSARWQWTRFLGANPPHLKHREITGCGHDGHTRVARQDQARSRILRDLGQARRRVGGIQRKQNGTGSRDGQHGHDRVCAAGNADADNIARSHPFSEQPVGPPAAFPFQIGVGQFPVPHDGGRGISHDGVCRGEQIVEPHGRNFRCRHGGSRRPQRIEFPGQQHIESRDRGRGIVRELAQHL